MNEVLLQLIGEGAPQQPTCAAAAFPFLLMFFAFYFFMLRPTQKQAQERREMLSRLTKGNRVVTSGGILGKIVAISDYEVTVEIADKVRVRVLKEEVELYTPPAGSASASQKS